MTGVKPSLWRAIVKNRAYYFMMAPFMLFFLFFTITPIVMSLPVSFTYFNMLEFPRWIGWANFQRLFLDDDIFLIAVQNTLVFAAITGPLSYFICLFFAWLVNEMPVKVRTFFTFAFYAPSISGSVYFMWIFLFSGDRYGFINGTLMRFGIINDPIQWLLDPSYNFGVVMLVQVWLSLGAGFLSFIAGFQSIDREVYEAAAIDGVRNRFQELVLVTLPFMGPQLMFAAVLQISASFTAGAVAMALTGFPSTDYSTHTIMTHAYDYGSVRFEMGYAAAICFVLFAAMMLANSLIRRLLSRFSAD